MKIIIDSNIVFSALLSSDNRFLDIIYSKNHIFFTCNFLFVEIFKYKDKIERYSKLNENELLTQLANVVSRIYFVNENTIPKEIFNIAYTLCKKIDEKDTPFVALTIFLDGFLLSRDEKLFKSLKEQGFTKIINIYNTF